MSSSKFKKKAKFKHKQSIDDIKLLYEEINHALEIKIVHLETQEGEVELGTVAQLTTSFGTQQIGLVDNIQLSPMGGRIPLSYSCFLQLPDLDDAAIDALISTPLFFCLMTKAETKKTAGGGKKKGSNETEISIPKPDHGGVVIGQGNLDILPLILGNGSYEQVVRLEVGGYIDTLFFQRSSSEDPRILVQLSDFSDCFSKVRPNNVMWITVESIFNPGEPYLFTDLEYTAVFPLPLNEIDIRSDSEISQETVDNEETKSDGGRAQKACGDGVRITPEDTKLTNLDSDNSHVSATECFSSSELQDVSSIQSPDSLIRVSDSESSSIDNDLSFCSGNPASTGHLLLDAPKTQKKKFDRSESARWLGDEEVLSVRKLSIFDRLQNFKLIEFPQGNWREEPEVDLRKTWSSLATVPGGPSKHHSRVFSDSSGLFSKFKVNLKRKMSSEHEPRIVWNMVRPLWLDEGLEQNVIRRIYKYGVWPIEIVVDEKAGAEREERIDSTEWKERKKLSKTGKRKKRDKEEQKNIGVRSFVAWVDLSTLLFPGNESVRVAGQLQLFDLDEGEELWGLQSTLKAKAAETLTRCEISSDYLTSKRKGKGDLKKDSTVRNEPKLLDTESTSTSRAGRRDHLAKDSAVKDVKLRYETDSLENKYSTLQQEYNDLKEKFAKLIGLSSGIITSSDEEGSGSESYDANEESKMFQTKETLEELSKIQHKKLLLKRYALASMRKKRQEKLIINKPEMLFSDNEPTFVVVEIKLLKPLIPKQPAEYIEANIKDLLPDRKSEEAVPRKRFFQDELRSSVHDICKLITQEYQDYNKLCDNEGFHQEDNNFYEYLERSRVHSLISENLRSVLSSYLVDTVGMPVFGSESSKLLNKDYIDWFYCRIMDEVHTVVNEFIIDTDRSTPKSFSENLPNISREEYFIFATEAAEEGDYEKAKHYLSKVLKGDGMQNPNNWFHYAVIAMRMNDYPKALECLREALILDVRHKESLLMYAVLLSSAGLLDAAELFFYAVIEFYPYFTEGWLALHLFYNMVERKVGSDTAFIMGNKCHNDFITKEAMKPPQLAWDTSSPSKEHSIFMRAAVYLLSFNLSEMAEICLAQDLENEGEKSYLFNYYLSVSHHIQGRYEDSCIHIYESIDNCQELKDSRIWILLGHNKWKIGEKREAVKVYQKAFSIGRLPRASHIALLRCGYYFLDCEKYELAKNMFILALKENKTPQVWLGLGLALYAMNKLDDAELALQEANVLDNQLAIAWAYLGLICLHRNQLVHSHQCFIEAKRCGLNDGIIEGKIRSLSELKKEELEKVSY